MSASETSFDSEYGQSQPQMGFQFTTPRQTVTAPTAPASAADVTQIGFTSFVQPTMPKNPQEDALQSLCKQILKSRLFCGFYEERRYVEQVNGYRDIVALQLGERELEKLLLDIRKRLQIFYQHKEPPMWIGITSGAIAGTTKNASALETHLWVELEGTAFGQYWFSVRSIRFREHEIIIKLKVVRPVEAETLSTPKIRSRYSSQQTMSGITAADGSTNCNEQSAEQAAANNSSSMPQEDAINLEDFVNIFRQWGASIKLALYEFMAQDINRQNLKEVLKFLALLLVSIITATLTGIKFLGMFTLRFMFEFSRLTHTLTPILLKLIEFFNKIVGGFYLLLAMIWKDAVVNRGKPQPPAQPQLAYNQPQYRAIKYEVNQQKHQQPKYI